MNIITEITPNPETLKFIVDTQLLNSKGVEFKNSNNIKKNKFVQDFFSLDGIESIFVGPNFISVTKKNKTTWGQLKPKILTFFFDKFFRPKRFRHFFYQHFFIDKN